MNSFYKYLIFFILGIILSLIIFKKDLVEGMDWSARLHNLEVILKNWGPGPSTYRRDSRKKYYGHGTDVECNPGTNGQLVNGHQVPCEDNSPYLVLTSINCGGTTDEDHGFDQVSSHDDCRYTCNRDANCTGYQYVFQESTSNGRCKRFTLSDFQGTDPNRCDINVGSEYSFWLKKSKAAPGIINLDREYDPDDPDDPDDQDNLPINSNLIWCANPGNNTDHNISDNCVGDDNGFFRSCSFGEPNDDKTSCVCPDGSEYVYRSNYGGYCTRCDEGEYSNDSPESNRQCVRAPLGYEPNDDKSGILRCGPGMVKGNSDTTCRSCGTTGIPNDEKSACNRCPDGQLVMDGECNYCEERTTPTRISGQPESCLPCPPGSEGRYGVCYDCPIGKYAPSGGICHFCPTGQTTVPHGRRGSRGNHTPQDCSTCLPNQISVQVPEWEETPNTSCYHEGNHGAEVLPGRNEDHVTNYDDYDSPLNVEAALSDCKRRMHENPDSNCFNFTTTDDGTRPSMCVLKMDCDINNCLASNNSKNYIYNDPSQQGQRCQDCPENHIPNTEDRSVCDACPRDTRPNTDDSNQELYREGISPGTVCVCPNGYNETENHSCLFPGQIESTPGEQSSRENCTSGTQPNEDYTTCISCDSDEIVTLKGPNTISDGTSCEVCGPGRGPNSDLTECINCEGNTYSNIDTQYSCNLCPPGTRTNDGKTSCTDVTCEAGQFVNEDGICTPCPYGTFSSESGNNVSCTQCGEGYITTSLGNITRNDCIECELDQHANYDKNQCVDCGLGQAGLNQDDCLYCSGNTTPNNNHSNCDLCPDGQTAVRGNDPQYFEEYILTPSLKSRCVDNPYCMIKPEDQGKYLKTDGEPVPDDGILLDNFDSETSNLTCRPGFLGIPRSEKCSDYGRYADLSGCVPESFVEISRSGNITCSNFSELNNIDMQNICVSQGKNMLHDKICNNIDDCLSTEFCCTKNISDKGFNLMGNIWVDEGVDPTTLETINDLISQLNIGFTNDTIDRILGGIHLKSGVLKSFKEKFNSLDNFKKNWIGSGTGQEEIVIDVWKRFINTINKYRIDGGQEKLILNNLDLNPENNSNITYEQLEKYVKLFVLLLDTPIKNDIKCSDSSYDNELDCINNFNEWQEYKYPICSDRTKNLINCTGNYTWVNPIQQVSYCSNGDMSIDNRADCVNIPIFKTGLSPLDLFLYNDQRRFNSSQLETLL